MSWWILTTVEDYVLSILPNLRTEFISEEEEEEEDF